ncbi:MAG TPA: hypothetical protein VFT22_02780, partial [Kofleriaceae bacterium]|nr:hypothetical protein [Kofleriaceae bacterium]
MIASWRGLAITLAIAAALAVVVAIDLGRTRRTEDRALVPGFDAERVTELRWDRPGQAPVRIVRAGAGWEERTAAAPGGEGHVPVDPGAVSDVLAALRGARWHRRGAPAPARATLTIIAGPASRALGLGEPIAGTEQRWITDGDRGLVVDGWVARALDRDRLALRIKAPLAGAQRARAIDLEGGAAGPGVLHLAGHPRQLAPPGSLTLAAGIAGELERALAAVTVVRVPDTPGGAPDAHRLAITTSGDGAPGRARVELALGGGCPGAPELVAASGTFGDGCVEPAALAAVERAIARLRQPAVAVAEPRPVPFEPQRIVLADGAVLDIPALELGDAAADPARVAE